MEYSTKQRMHVQYLLKIHRTFQKSWPKDIESPVEVVMELLGIPESCEDEDISAEGMQIDSLRWDIACHWDSCTDTDEFLSHVSFCLETLSEGGYLDE